MGRWRHGRVGASAPSGRARRRLGSRCSRRKPCARCSPGDEVHLPGAAPPYRRLLRPDGRRSRSRTRWRSSCSWRRLCTRQTAAASRSAPCRIDPAPTRPPDRRNIVPLPRLLRPPQSGRAGRHASQRRVRLHAERSWSCGGMASGVHGGSVRCSRISDPSPPAVLPTTNGREPAMPERLASQLDPAKDGSPRSRRSELSTPVDTRRTTSWRRWCATSGAGVSRAWSWRADKDMAQLVGPGVWLCVPGSVDRHGCRGRARALRGAAGSNPRPPGASRRWMDHIPGLPGIGERTALRLLATSGPVSALWDGPAALGISGCGTPRR